MSDGARTAAADRTEGGSARSKEPDAGRPSAPAGGRAVQDLFATDEIFHRVIATASEEFGRSTRQLFSSGLAAGLSMSLSFIGAAALPPSLTLPVSG
ncbi:MAG: hypothetical protein R3266_09355 [Gemmatimonadota bacterium]|nr:hypothetical protein [Gemmatimonadota bacterium]